MANKSFVYISQNRNFWCRKYFRTISFFCCSFKAQFLEWPLHFWETGWFTCAFNNFWLILRNMWLQDVINNSGVCGVTKVTQLTFRSLDFGTAVVLFLRFTRLKMMDQSQIWKGCKVTCITFVFSFFFGMWRSNVFGKFFGNVRLKGTLNLDAFVRFEDGIPENW